MKNFLKIFLLALMIFSVAACGSDDNEPVTADTKDKSSAEMLNKKSDKPAKVSSPEKIQPVVISFAGDCTLGSFLGSDYAFENYWENGAEYYLGNVKEIFAADDITFVNLEGPLTDNPQTAVDKQFPMRGEPKYVAILTSASVEICNLSNNHIYDCGDVGFQDTTNILKTNGVKFCGEGFSEIIDVRGMKIGFLGYQAWYDTDELREKISSDIKKIRERGAQAVIVEFHWGDESSYVSDPYQDAIAHFTIDSGADVVVGAHPHVMQGIEVYKEKIIAYSLGNFCFGANNNPRDKETFILQTTLTRDGEKISVKPHVIPCRISSTNSYNDFCPTPVTGEEAEQILAHLADSSKKYLQTIDLSK